MWDINVRYDKILIDKKERKGIIIDIAVPADVRVREKEREKMKKCQDLKRETGRLWKLKTVEVFPDGWTEKLGLTNNVGVMQKIALLGTARILRKVLEM